MRAPPIWLIATLATAVLVLAITKVRAHDIYTHWKQPGTQMPCCSGGDEPGDCYPTDAKFRNGVWFALRREDQKWIAVPENKVTDQHTYDAHLCAPPPSPWNKDDVVYCFSPPTPGS